MIGKIIPFTSHKKVVNDPNQVGMFQYYFSDKYSKLPIRDVNNTCGEGNKTEPHLEIGAENYIKTCTQNKISDAIKRGLKYLFLVTQCRNKELKDFFGKQFIVGYIQIEESIPRIDKKGKPFWAIRGQSKVFDYKDAICIPDLFGRNLNRGDLSKKIDEKQTREFLDHFKDKQDITQEWVDEVNRVDVNQITCIGAGNCAHCAQCKRFNKVA